MGCPDFTTLSNQQVIAFAIDHAKDFERALSPDDFEQCVFEKRHYGFAVIQSMEGRRSPHLLLLYINVDSRDDKLGSRLLREVKAKYAEKYPMTLTCYGTGRGAFFGRVGFRIQSTDHETGVRTMIMKG